MPTTRSRPYRAGLRYIIEAGGKVTLAQLFLAITAAIEPDAAFEAGIAQRRRLAKRFGKEDQIKTGLDHKLLALGERRIAWNIIQRLSENGRINIEEATPGSPVRLVTLGVPPTTGGRHAREQSWEDVLRDLDDSEA